MSLKKDIIEAEFRTSGANKIQNEISTLEGDISRLNRENNRMLINKKKLESQNKKNTKEWKFFNAQIKKNNEIISINKQKLNDLKEEMFNLRFQKSLNRLENQMRIKDVKKDIARILTLMTERQKTEIKA